MAYIVMAYIVVAVGLGKRRVARVDAMAFVADAVMTY